ncbi:glycoside hydrolase family 3 C-terminal domain-containing protein [Kineococcus sp. NUM-3379]
MSHGTAAVPAQAAPGPGAARALPPFRDPALPLPERVDDLLARLTPDERLAMLHQHCPAVPRLGLAAFRTGTEALHGVAWLGAATVFPQPVGLAATWDAELLTRVGTAVGREVRARRATDPTVSLNVWAPVVNPLRHPLWGRTEEGFSEDPHLTGELAAAYARGLRGDHERVWLTVPTLKHFLAYSNETDRATTSSQLRARVLHEYELPAFRIPVEAGVVGAVMLSYNLVNGVPAHVSPLVAQHLRRWTAGPDDLTVVTDAGAPQNLVHAERAFPDATAADAAALRAGVDSFTDDGEDPGVTLRALGAALESGLISPADVDAAARRVLTLRLRTGELDAGPGPHDGIGPGELGRAEHVALAREAAAAGVVVLRNRSGVLPLAGTGTVALVGPLADLVLTDWYSGTPTATTSLAAALRERLGSGCVLVADGSDRVALRSTATGRYVTTDPRDGRLLATGATAGPEAQFDVTDWGQGVVTLRSAATGRLVSGAALRADADRVGGWVVQESFRLHDHGDGTVSLRHLGSGRWVRPEATTGALGATAADASDAGRFTVRTVRSGVAVAVQAATAADTVVAVVGNDPHLGGRETEDRRTLELPGASAELVRAVREANPACVLAVVSSYPYALGDLAADVDGIVWSGHAGQEVGNGLADVLLGDVEPRGRLAQTWFASDADLPDVLDYDVQSAGGTYLWSRAEVLYPFGHGLGYTRVEYTAVEADTGGTPGEVTAADAVTLRVQLENTGARAAEELVQVYATAPGIRPEFPRRRLVAHRRVRVEPGARAAAELTVPVAALATYDVAREREDVVPGRYFLLVGASAEDVRHEVALTVSGPARGPRPLGPACSFDACRGVELVPRDGLSGTAVRVADRGLGGAVDFDDCATAGAEVLRCTASGPGELRVALRGASGAWREVGGAQVPAGGWHAVDVALRGPLPERADLRVRLSGEVSLAELAPLPAT